MTRNLGTHPSQLLYPTFSKFFLSFYMVITLHNLKLLLFPIMFSCTTISKCQLLANMNFFGLVIPLMFFGRNYVSSIFTIISNITVLVSHHVIFFGYFMSISHGVYKKAPAVVSHHISPRLSAGFFFFYKKYLINLFLL